MRDRSPAGGASQPLKPRVVEGSRTKISEIPIVGGIA